jgi:hypothetical protein
MVIAARKIALCMDAIKIPQENSKFFQQFSRLIATCFLLKIVASRSKRIDKELQE